MDKVDFMEEQMGDISRDMEILRTKNCQRWKTLKKNEVCSLGMGSLGGTVGSMADYWF